MRQYETRADQGGRLSVRGSSTDRQRLECATDGGRSSSLAKEVNIDRMELKVDTQTI